MTKLAILEERDEDKYDTFTTVKCWLCDAENGKEVPEELVNDQVRETIFEFRKTLTPL